MTTRARLLLLLLFLLQDHALTTDADGDTEACSGHQTLDSSACQTDPLAGTEQAESCSDQQTIDSSACQTDPLAGTEQAESCSDQQTIDSSECQTDPLADTEQADTLMNSLASGLQKMFTPDAESPEQDVDDGSEFDFNEFIASAKAMADIISVDEGEFRERASIFWSNMMAPEEDEVLATEGDSASFLYPPLTRRTPQQPGEVLELDIGEGEMVKLIALSVNPPLFEIPNFLTDEECDHIIFASQMKGTVESVTFTTKADIEKGNNKGIERVSESAVLEVEELGQDLADRLHTKVAKLIDMPVEVVRDSAPLVIGKYNEGGHYYAHLDSNQATFQTPCCFQKRCFSEQGIDIDYEDCCRFCRYATMLHYLNDVEYGGETAFPLADLTWTQISEKDDWQNLTATCHEAAVRVKPEKGKTILWYNHFVDKKGYLGAVDTRSFHGGCDVLKGTKWIATNWISTPRFSQRRVPSKYSNGKNKDV